MTIFKGLRIRAMLGGLLAGLAVAFFSSLPALSPALAADESLEDLAWLTGTWLETREDGSSVEVIWSEPRGNAMVGTWRSIKGGELQAYEILTMRQTGDGIFYRFDLYRKAAMFVAPKSTSFKLAGTGDRRAVFDLQGGAGQITIEITDKDRLRGAWADPDQPEIPPAVGYDAARVE